MTDAELAFQFAKEVSTQLITISSALIGVSVTFIKDFKADGHNWLRTSWLFYILSILLGVTALMSLTGALERLAISDKPFEHFEKSTTLSAGGQIICFAIGTICLVLFGWKHSLQRHGANAAAIVPSANQATPP